MHGKIRHRSNAERSNAHLGCSGSGTRSLGVRICRERITTPISKAAYLVGGGSPLIRSA